MGEIEKALRKHAIPEGICVECGDCGMTLFEAGKSNPMEWEPHRIASIIEMEAKSHSANRGHMNVDVQIDKTPSTVREIDATITVNE